MTTKESKQNPPPAKTKKQKQKNKRKETRYLNQLVFNKKIYSLYCFFKQQSTLPRLEAAVPSRNKKSLGAWISVQKVQEHERGKKKVMLSQCYKPSTNFSRVSPVVSPTRDSSLDSALRLGVFSCGSIALCLGFPKCP